MNPSARWTPNAGSRRCTSACAPAASIVPAATSATSENAISSDSTIPAAWPSRTSIPARVTNASPPMPNDVARACVSVMSARSGSASHSSARFTGGSSPRAATYTRGVTVSGNATLSGSTATPTIRNGPARPSSSRSPGASSPFARQPALDDDLVPARASRPSVIA